MTSTAAFAPTAEQNTALALFKTGRSLAIEAGAGAGKTSTLKLFADSTPRRIQYVAFNKPIVEESKAKMPRNVACNTAHSLAWKNVIPGTRFQERLRNSRRMKSLDIAQRLGINESIRLELSDGTVKVLARGFLAGLTMRAVTSFCQSADPLPTEEHVPYIDGIDVPPFIDGRRNRSNNRIVAKALVPWMRRAWADITDEHGSLSFRHDHYLKMWQLSGPRINADVILFDEAQDANPVLVDIVRQQTHAQLVWVGDSQQQIYGFTGAINALATVGAEQETFLTQSFRFGPEIAAKANEVLGMLDAKIRLTGTEGIPSTVAAVDRPTVYLSRTNAAAVRRLLDEISEGRRPHLVGGGREVLEFAKAARELQAGEWVDHPELACFTTWAEVQEYVEQDEQGGDLKLMVDLLDEFGADMIISSLQNMPEEEQADLVISTAHKSKGREWDTVQLADDFPAEPRDEELRLLYVAVTRAKLTVDVTAVRILNGGFTAPLTQDAVEAVAVAATEPDEIGIQPFAGEEALRVTVPAPVATEAAPEQGSPKTFAQAALDALEAYQRVAGEDEPRIEDVIVSLARLADERGDDGRLVIERAYRRHYEETKGGNEDA